MTTAALASVAWPHSGTSTVGVNQRRRKSLAVGHQKAVSARLFSAAIACSAASSAKAIENHDGGRIAGEPAAGEGVDLIDRNVHGTPPRQLHQNAKAY